MCLIERFGYSLLSQNIQVSPKCPFTLTANAMNLRILSVTTLLPALAYGYSVRGYDALGRPVTLRRASGSQAAARAFRQQQMQAVDQAFESLRNDLQMESSDEVVAKSKQWIDRSFGLIEELNRDASFSEEEAVRNEEMLAKQRKWAKKMVEFAVDLGKDISVKVPADLASSTSNKQATNSDGVVIPPSSIKDNETAFQVEVELPGVQLSDVDLELEKETETLVISAERQALGSDQVTKFSKRFGLDPTIDADKITASLSDGILRVNAPKEIKATKHPTKKIPVNAGE